MNQERILSEQRLRALFSRTFEHPVLKGKIDMVSLEWMLEMGNPAPRETADSGDGSGARVSMEELWESLLRDGMKDPIILGVGRATRRIRLESGNHKARLLLENGILFAPAACYVGDEAITRKENGEHEGRPVRLWLPEASASMGAYSEKYFARPTEIVPSAPAFAFEGWARARKPAERGPREPRERPAAGAAGSGGAEEGK